MKKVLFVCAVLIGLSSCKKDKVCDCVTVRELGKLSMVKGVEITTWNVTDTLSIFGGNCDLNGNTVVLSTTVRERTICN